MRASQSTPSPTNKSAKADQRLIAQNETSATSAIVPHSHYNTTIEPREISETKRFASSSPLTSATLNMIKQKYMSLQNKSIHNDENKGNIERMGSSDTDTDISSDWGPGFENLNLVQKQMLNDLNSKSNRLLHQQRKEEVQKKFNSSKKFMTENMLKKWIA